MIKRCFLGSDTHLLHAVADHLITHARVGDEVNLAGHLVVLPTARARRRLESLLLDRTAGLYLTPPDIVTPSAMIERLVVPQQAIASEVATRYAWWSAAKALDPNGIAALTGHDGDMSVIEQWSLMERVRRVCKELAQADLTPRIVVDRCEAEGLTIDPDVWRAIIQWHADAMAILEQWHLQDRDACIHQALNDGHLNTHGLHAITVISADPGLRLERCLEQLAQAGIDITVAIHGTSEDIEPNVTAFGGVDVDHWSTCHIDIPSDVLTACPSEDDQAASVLDFLAQLGAQPASCVRVVAPDEALQRVMLTASRSEGLPMDGHAGRPMSSGWLGGLFALLEQCALHQSAARYGDLLRHPAVEAWMQRAGMSHPINIWDAAWAAHTPRDLTCFADVATDSSTTQLLQQLERLTKWMRSSIEVSDWADRLVRFLVDLLDGAEVDEQVAAELTILHGLFTDLYEMPPDIGAVDAATALRMVMSILETTPMPTEPSTGGVELIGWLDAHLDDAPHLVVMGMNGGIIPAAMQLEPWLPERHRELLGLDCPRRRAARDAYLLTAMLQSGRSIQLTSAQRHRDGTPMTPSSLLLREQGPALASRMLAFVGEDDHNDAPTLASRQPAGAIEDAFDPHPMPEGDPVIRSMSVTAFKDYIQDPYGFMLKRDTRIRTEYTETTFELDAMKFGSLIHDALEIWGREEVVAGVATIDETRIEADLHAALDQIVAKQFGSNPLHVVRLQCEMARTRLSAFAHQQAIRAAEGWKIFGVEYYFGWGDEAHAPAVLFPDTQGLPLTGRIDRIDVHDSFGYQALDYKTSASGDGPLKAHGTAQKGWSDLQLPLYRVLLRSIGVEVPCAGLGYVTLPPKAVDCRFELAKWSEVDLEDAEGGAADIVQAIVDGRLCEVVEAEWT